MARGYPPRVAGRSVVPAAQASPHVTNSGQAMGRGRVSDISSNTASRESRRRCPHSQSSRIGFWMVTCGRTVRNRAASPRRRRFLNVHLVPALGSTRLDAITTEHVQQLKHRLRSKAPKTVNNVLTVLNVLLKKAAEWGVIERTACSIRLLPIPKASACFYDFDEYERLVEAALRTTKRLPNRAAGQRLDSGAGR